MSSKESYSEYTKQCKNQNSVWIHFLRGSKKLTAKCKICNEIVKTAGSTTTPQHTHLRTMHNINVLKRDVVQDEVPESSASKMMITNYLVNKRDESLSAIVSRMCALDNMPFKVFCTSIDLRNLFLARGIRDYVLPKSPNSIRKMVLEYAQKMRAKMMQDFIKFKEDGTRFCLTLDEWTSSRNRCYLNVNVHGKKQFWNLGLVRVEGRFPAEKCITALKTTLQDNNLNIDKDITSITTDGVAVMQKVGRLLPCNQQLCFAHAIHLAVINVLYNNSNTTELVAHIDTENVSVEEQGSDFQESDKEYVDDESVGLIEQIYIEAEHAETEEFGFSFLIKKVRSIVKKFRFSRTSNDILQVYVKQEFGKELKLIMDTRTRWNSLVEMLERFNQLKSCVRKALIDIASDIVILDAEILSIKNIISALLPVKLTVEALCREDANLLSADAALSFMLENFGSDELSLKLKNELEDRISRRRTNVSGTLQYLHNGGKSDIHESFTRPLKNTIAKVIESFAQRLIFNTNMETSSGEQSESDDVVEVMSEEQANSQLLMQKLQNKIQLNLSSNIPSSSTQQIINRSLITKIKSEMKFFEENGVRGKILEFVYSFLILIPPSSVESERAFSIAGNFCTKIRSRLGDAALSDLCFLKAYFRQIKQ